MKYIICAVVFFFSMSAQASMGSYLNEYVHKVESVSASVFYTSCVSHDYNVWMLVEVGAGHGHLIEYKGSDVVNIATISIKSGSVKVDETHGGVYTYDRVHKLTENLLSREFYFAGPQQLRSILRVPPSSQCPD